MRDPPRERPLYLTGLHSTCFAVAHEPTVVPSTGTGVLLCAPFGWDDVASYRPRRAWAQAMAAAGHLVLRSDAPGSGDSAGGPADPGLLDAWCAAVTTGERWLRAAGSQRVVVVGLGMGGLVAARAAEDCGASIDGLVLWGVPQSGRAAVRRLRVSSRLQADQLAEPGGGLPDGWLEVGGHVLSAETLDALDRLTLRQPVSRVLVLERPGVAADVRLAEVRGAARATVTRAPGPGYEQMVEHPQTSVEPLEAMSAVARWLADVADAGTAGRVVRATSAAELALPAHAARETPVAIPHGGNFLTGVLTTPTRPSAARVGAVFFNAGAIRRIGPNRLWTETARRWAASGVTSLRLDFDGIGDSGSPSGPLSTPSFYVADLLAQGRTAVDWITAHADVERVLTVGLCAGGRIAFGLAAEDRRVATAVVVNATALTWDRNLEITQTPPGPRLLFRSGYLRGSADARRTMPRDFARWSTATARREATFRATRRRIERLLDATRAHDTRVVLALNEGEPEQLRLVSSRNRWRLRRWPNVEIARIPSTDHALRPVLAQLELRRILDEALGRELARRAFGR